MAGWIEKTPLGTRIHIHAQPGAKVSMVGGLHGDALKIKIHAPPVEGKANEELIRFLAERLGCRRNQISVTAGSLGREKTLLVMDLPFEDIVKKLGEK